MQCIRKKFCILKLLIVGPSCEECPSDKGGRFLFILSSFVCVCACVCVHKIIRISRVKAKLLRKACTVYSCNFFPSCRSLCHTSGFSKACWARVPRAGECSRSTGGRTVVFERPLCWDGEGWDRAGFGTVGSRLFFQSGCDCPGGVQFWCDDFCH